MSTPAKPRAVDESALSHLAVRSRRARFRRCGIEFTQEDRAVRIKDHAPEVIARLEGEAELFVRRIGELEAARIEERSAPAMTLEDALAKIADLEAELARVKRGASGIKARVADARGETVPPGAENAAP